MLDLEAESITLVANDEYTRRINLIAEHASQSTQTTGDDGYRMLQLLTHLRGPRPRFEFDRKFAAPAGSGKYVNVPGSEASNAALHKFAHTYNVFNRMFSDLDGLQLIFAPHVEQFARTNQIRQDLGVDFLRAFLFVIARADQFVNGFFDEHEELARVLVEAIRLRAGFRVPDLS